MMTCNMERSNGDNSSSLLSSHKPRAHRCFAFSRAARVWPARMIDFPMTFFLFCFWEHADGKHPRGYRRFEGGLSERSRPRHAAFRYPISVGKRPQFAIGMPPSYSLATARAWPARVIKLSRTFNVSRPARPPWARGLVCTILVIMLYRAAKRRYSADPKTVLESSRRRHFRSLPDILVIVATSYPTF